MTSFDGTVLIVRRFTPDAECHALSRWALKAVAEGQFVDGVHRNDQGAVERVKFRLTNRLSDRIEYPALVYDLRRRIAEALGLTRCAPIRGHGKDGIVVSVTYDGGDVYRHTDPPVEPGCAGLRCNLLAQAPTSGGKTFVKGAGYDLRAGDLQCYLVTDHSHHVETCYGTPRILFMFGWCV